MKRIVILIWILAFLLSGCVMFGTPGQNENTEPDETQIPTAETAEPGPQGSERFGLSYLSAYGFNPYSCTCITNRPVMSLVYEGLFVMGNHFQPEPVLCDKFAVSESGRYYIFKLCEGVRFSDGSPLTARDVVASLEQARGSEYYGTRFLKVAEFKATDDYTVAVTLYYAYENLPLLLDVPIVKAGTETSDRPIGSGPYAFSGGGQNLCLQRNHDWWQDRAAPIDAETVTLTAAVDALGVRNDFEFGATSLVCADLNSPTAVGYRCDYELWDCPTTTMQYLGFNLASGLFMNREFRASVTHIIDRDSISATVYKGFAEPAYLPCAPSSPLYDQELAQKYTYDKEAFLTAKTNSGVYEEYVGTLLVCSSDPSRIEMAYRIADSFNDAGIKMEVSSVDYDSFLYRLYVGQYDCFLGETRLSANFDLSEFFRVYGSLNFGGIQNSSMEQLCYDALENTGNCYDLERSVMENAYFCPILFKSYAVMVTRGVITNLQPAMDNVFHLAGGRTLADATITYDEIMNPNYPGQTEETEETEEILP